MMVDLDEATSDEHTAVNVYTATGIERLKELDGF
jgi:hypothetical protein